MHADKTPSLKVKDDDRKDDGIDVVCFAGCDWKDVKDTLKRQGLLPEFHAAMLRPLSSLLPVPQEAATSRKLSGRSAGASVASADHDDADQRVERALKIWNASKPISGTLGQKYLAEHRGLNIGKVELDHALRFHAGFDAVMALMTTPIGNEPCGVHRTFLNRNGSKRERKMLGVQGVVRLSPDEDVTHGLGIVEGIEDGLSVLLSGWAPMGGDQFRRDRALPGARRHRGPNHLSGQR